MEHSPAPPRRSTIHVILLLAGLAFVAGPLGAPWLHPSPHAVEGEAAQQDPYGSLPIAHDFGCAFCMACGAPAAPAVAAPYLDAVSVRSADRPVVLDAAGSTLVSATRARSPPSA